MTNPTKMLTREEQIEMLRQGLLASEWCGYSKRGIVNELCDLAEVGRQSLAASAAGKARHQRYGGNDSHPFGCCRGLASNEIERFKNETAPAHRVIGLSGEICVDCPALDRTISAVPVAAPDYEELCWRLDKLWRQVEGLDTRSVSASWFAAMQQWTTEAATAIRTLQGNLAAPKPHSHEENGSDEPRV